jgi:hypothetical protein
MTTTTCPPIPGFALGHPDENRRLPFGSADPSARSAARLSDRHRPAWLADIVGQSYAVLQLADFVASPYPSAWFFAGETGAGKTTAAMAVARELGAVEYGGLWRIESGTQTDETVTAALESLRYTPMLGSGWKVIVVDEADHSSPKAKQLWLSALESLPSKSVIIFTTNHPEKFDTRFLDRCERLEFASDAAMLGQDAQNQINLVWLKETGDMDAPNIDDLPGVVIDGVISFRRAVDALTPLIRDRLRGQSRVVGVDGAAGRPTVKATTRIDRTVQATKSKAKSAGLAGSIGSTGSTGSTGSANLDKVVPSVKLERATVTESPIPSRSSERSDERSAANLMNELARLDAEELAMARRYEEIEKRQKEINRILSPKRKNR